jgi:hypothetical protein
MDKSKKGFGGQWVDIFKVGTHTDDAGAEHVIGMKFLEQVVSNFDLQLHEPPATIGHPKSNAPAYGWVCDLRATDAGILQAQFCDVEPQFEEMVRQGRFKKRSSAFYLDPRIAPNKRVPALNHVAFLGARTPAVKGLKEIDFSEGEAITFDNINFSEGESMDEEKVKSTVAESIKEYFKNLFGGSKETDTQANFSEADVKRIAEDAVKTATASFTEENKALKTLVEDLAKQVSQQSGVMTHAEIVAFCESLGKANFPPAFNSMGVIEFMETLAAIPGDVKVSIISFEEKDGQKKEIKTESAPLTWFKNFLKGIGPVIQFGEQFGKLSGNAETPVDTAGLEKMREGMGITKKSEGGAK